MNENMEDQTLVCDLTAIPASAREEHVITAPQLFQSAQEVQELPDGYAFRFLNEPGKFLAIAKYIENERLCCPFFRFGLELEPHAGSIWLRLTGAEGVKEMLGSVLLESRGEIAELKKSIHTGDDPKLDGIIAALSLPILENPPKRD